MTEGLSFHERRILRAQQSTQAFGRAHACNQPSPSTPQQKCIEEEDIEPMASSIVARDSLIKHGLEGFLRVAGVPPHEELEVVPLTIDIEKISE